MSSTSLVVSGTADFAKKVHQDSVRVSIAAIGDERKELLRDTSRLIQSLGDLLRSRGIEFNAKLRAVDMAAFEHA